MSRICILDYGSGNVGSVYNLCISLGASVVVSNTREAIADATHVILPGVGAFGAAMRRIRERLPVEHIERVILNGGKPFLGVCVGMQVLANRGTEFGEYEGLGWIGGSVDRMETGSLPLPHMGWNNVEPAVQHALFDGLGESPDFYYVHSYAFRAADPAHVLATTDFGESFTAALHMDNMLGVQFHPEKSQRAGQRLIQNFLDIS